MTLRIATLNIRNIADRWDERLPLLLADAAALQPDVYGLQEVVYALQQDRLIGAAGAATYEVLRGWAGRPEYGNSLLVRSGLSVSEVAREDLGLGRSALRAVVATPPTGASVVVTVAHLHSPPNDHAERVEQIERLLAWLGDPKVPQIVMGDFNADPREPACAAMVAAGYRSAYAAMHGAEPPVTWPSGIIAEGMDTDGDPDCLDYIWVRGTIDVCSARLVFDRPAVDDPTLYPSDHVGIVAELDIRA
jgi:endonuclease/exonuclease/phosphatase family metal-dependent hydrolase